MSSFFYSPTNLPHSAGTKSSKSRDKKALSKLALEAARLNFLGGVQNVEKPGNVNRGLSQDSFSSNKAQELLRSNGSVPPESLDHDYELVQLRKDFQYQQDRLYAWGVGWSEICARRGSSTSMEHLTHQATGHGLSSPQQIPSQASQHGYSDKDANDYDQSTLGDLVSGIMDEIKKLLDQSGQLSHPGRYDQEVLSMTDSAPDSGSGLAKEKSGWNLNLNLNLTRQRTPPSFAGHELPKLGRKDSNGLASSQLQTHSQMQPQEWKIHELVTGRALLEQLRNCIDVLYSLVDDSVGSAGGSQQSQQHIATSDMEKAASPLDRAPSFQKLPTPSGEPVNTNAQSSKFQHYQQRDLMSTSSEFAVEAQIQAFMQKIHAHPLHIDFAQLQPMHDPNIDGDYFESGNNLPPPSYDDAQQQIMSLRARSMYFYAHAQAHVIVDLVSVNPINLPSLLSVSTNNPNVDKTTSPFQELHSLAQRLSGDGLLSWDGHMKVLGFTLAGSRTTSKFGLVYALPAPSDPTILQSYQTLTSSLLSAGSGANEDQASPPLENKFRLAYNIALLVAGYLAHGSTHGYLRSGNIVFLKETDGPRNMGAVLRSPYLLQPAQALVGLGTDTITGAPASETIYHHPDAELYGYGTLAAHDIYSVGLLLLEVGMWLPLRRFWKSKYDQNRHIFVDRLLRSYTPKLASKCGSRYMKIVQKCLSAPENLADKPDTADAAEYLLEIMKELSQCCVLDEAGTPSPLDIEVIEALIDESRVNTPAKLAAANMQKPNDVTSPPVVPEKPLSMNPGDTHPTALARRVGGGASSSSKRRVASAATSGPPKLHKYPDLPIPQDKLITWNTVLLPKLQKVLTRALADSPESASANLMMIGPSPEKATTTIVIQCTDTGHVHEKLKASLKGKLGIGRGWGLVVIKGDIRRSGQRTRRELLAQRSGGGPRRSKHDGRHKVDLGPASAPSQREYQPRPLSGASIGAFKDGEHMPPVSLGGTVLVDGKPFAMSVHHMLDDVSERGSEDEDTDMDIDPDHPVRSALGDAYDVQRSSLKNQQSMADLDLMGSHIGADLLAGAPHQLEFSDEEDFGEGDDFQLYDDSDSDTSTIRPDYSMFDDDGNEYWFMDDDDGDLPGLEDDELSEGSSSDESVESIGDKPGFLLDTDMFDEDEVCVTQPALDDVDDDFFPSLEDRDDDHLTSHSLGFVHASSGIRRKIYDDSKHEIDWALIRVNEERCSFLGRSRRSKVQHQSQQRYSQSLPITPDGSHLTRIAPLASLPNTQVVTVARTSGPARGKISQAMSLIKFHGRTSFASSYTVEGGFGVPGDSGAWVWNEERNELCGHILAWADGLKVAFLGPMEVMVEDMKAKLGAERIELLGAYLEREHSLLRDITNMKPMENKSNLISINATNMEANKQKTRMNAKLERAQELEAAIKRMSLDSSASASHASRSRDNSGDTFLTQSSRCSSASSGYSRNEGDGRSGSGHRERFDLHLSGRGGQDVMHIPMARAS